MKILDSDVPSVDNLVLQARDVEFDWSATPSHFVYGDPVATHVFNAVNLLLPAGEEWFVSIYQEALALVEDEDLRDEMMGFIGQESMHAQSHSGIQEFLTDKGIDYSRFLERVEWIFEKFLGERPLSTLRERNYLVERLALIAALEHLFSSLGDWLLNAPEFDAKNVSPEIVAIFKWHAAEEVEHRMVSHHVLTYFDASYTRRVRAGVVAFPVLVYLTWQGTRHLLANDPELIAEDSARARRRLWRPFIAAGRRGVVPSIPTLLIRSIGYFSPWYNPETLGDTSQATAYLASASSTRAVRR